jgi:hypothetical protein
MKKCSYCGAEYPNDAVMCAIDQTPFASEAPTKFADIVRWTPKSPLELALTSGLAAFLICTSIYFAVGRVTLDIWRIHHVSDTVVPGKLGLYVSPPPSTWHTIPRHSYVSLFSLGALIFTFIVCYNRCQKKSHGVITAIITFGIICLLTFMPFFVPRLASFLWLVPTVIFTIITNSSVFFYIGAALQIFAGAWLLGWFRQQKPPNNVLEPTPNAP